MRPRSLLFTAVAALALSACDRSADPTVPVPVAEGAADSATGAEAAGAPAPVAPAALPAESGAGPGAQMGASGADIRAFTCESDHQVELVGDELARVTLADGRVIELPRKPDGVAEYRGEALTFDIDEDGGGGVLGQDEVGGFACEPAD